MLTVEECVPFLGFSSRTATSLRTASVDRLSDSLSLPWIKGLPGEKRVRFFHGQVFVIQRYLGMTLIRAHIYHAQEKPGETHMREVSGFVKNWDDREQDTAAPHPEV